jgi:N-acetylgalactosamine-N,N'-diacetylbacillosaminyl-diphospho-undecaprenol 4-alpha-N-acetylgalactosaminyltransferase
MTKICLITDSLGKGGAEQMTAKLSRAFQNCGYEVYIIILKDQIDYRFSGQLINLGKNISDFKFLKQYKKVIAFKKVYKSIDADIYIDFRVRSRSLMEFVLHQYVFEISKTIFSIRSYNVFLHIPKNRYFFKSYSNCRAIVCPTKAILNLMKTHYDFKNLVHIPNFIIKNEIDPNFEKTSNTFQFVIAAGRLNNNVKQFDKLIKAYKHSDLIKSKIRLLIFGDGKDRNQLENLIFKEHLQDLVFLEGFNANLESIFGDAYFTLLCSKYEGFPNVLLESLSSGTPVVSFDCKSGPSDLVQNGKNGILVEDQNFEALIHAMNKMINDKDFYKTCKNNAKTSVEKFSSFEVIKSWENLINKS